MLECFSVFVQFFAVSRFFIAIDAVVAAAATAAVAAVHACVKLIVLFPSGSEWYTGHATSQPGDDSKIVFKCLAFNRCN